MSTQSFHKLLPLIALSAALMASACSPKHTDEETSASAEEPAALSAPADDVAGRDSAAALEAAMAASPSAVDLAVSSAQAASVDASH